MQFPVFEVVHCDFEQGVRWGSALACVDDFLRGGAVQLGDKPLLACGERVRERYLLAAGEAYCALQHIELFGFAVPVAVGQRHRRARQLVQKHGRRANLQLS